ncbi:MAG: 3-coathanger stack domain-containing protein [Bacteroidota bacterium]
MKLLLRLVAILTLCLSISVNLRAQELIERIKALNNTKYIDWLKTFEDFNKEQRLKGSTSFSGTGHNQLGRMLWYYRDRLDNDGNFANSDLYNFNAYKKFVRDNQAMPFASVSPQTAEWNYGGPFNIRNNSGVATGTGRVTFVKLDPNDAGNASSATIYVGAPKGGLWRGEFNKSTGLVPTWTCLTDGLPNIGAVDLCIHPSNPNVMYLVSGDKNAGIGNTPSGIGIMKTTDGGTTWLPTAYYDDIPPSFNYGNVRKLMMDNSNPNRMWAATTAGIVRTTDGWQTFTTEQGGSFWDIEKGDNSSNQNLIACTSSRVYTSADYGATWAAVQNDAGTADFTFSSSRAELAVSSNFSSNRTFYLWSVSGTTSTIQYYNGGTSDWTQKYSASLVTVYTDYCMSFEASQTNFNFIYAGGLELKQSSDGGASWIDIGDGVPGGGTFGGGIHADNHYIAWDQGYLFLGNDGGVYNYNYSNGGAGAGWRYISDGLHISQYYRIAYCNNANGFRALGGAQDMGTHNSSIHFGCCDGMECLVDYNNPDILYYSRQDALVYRSTNNGVSGADFMPAGFGNGNVWITPMAMHKTNPAIVALAQTDETDGNDGKIQIYNGSWSVKATNTSSFIWLAFAKSAPNVMYGITGSQIVKISDVTAASPTVTTYTLPTAGATCVAVDPNNSAHVFYTIGGYGTNRVYESTNSGQTWTPITLNLPSVPVNCILMGESANDDIYIGTELGVFVKLGAWNYWAPFMNGLPNTRVTDLEIDGGLLTCATYGRGRWFTNLYGSCVPDLDLTPANDPSSPTSTGNQYYTASDSISSTRIIQGGAGTNVTYRAGNSVTLKQGFHAKVNNEFLGMIGPCFPGNPAPLGGVFDSTYSRTERQSSKVPSPKYNYMKPAGF